MGISSFYFYNFLLLFSFVDFIVIFNFDYVKILFIYLSFNLFKCILWWWWWGGGGGGWGGCVMVVVASEGWLWQGWWLRRTVCHSFFVLPASVLITNLM
jgi:hypothetical protein